MRCRVYSCSIPPLERTLPPLRTVSFPCRLRLQLDEVERDLKDPRRFGDALAILQTQEFQKKDMKRVFNAYSDNIYYLVRNRQAIDHSTAGFTAVFCFRFGMLFHARRIRYYVRAIRGDDTAAHGTTSITQPRLWVTGAGAARRNDSAR